MVEDTRVCCEMIKSGDVVCAYYYCYNYTTNEKLIFSNEKRPSHSGGLILRKKYLSKNQKSQIKLDLFV